MRFADQNGVAARSPIRHRLLTILLLGAIVSALSVGALARLLSVSTQHRIERARDEVSELLLRLARDDKALSNPAPGNVVGMRAGLSDGGSQLSAPATWTPELERALREPVAAVPRTSQVALASSTLVLGTVRAQAGRVGWAALEVRPLPHLETWKFTIWLLSFATIVLVVKGGPRVGQHLNLLGVYFPGYRVTLLGSFIGFIYMFVIGYGVGRVIGTLYNWLVDMPNDRAARSRRV